MKIFLIGLLNDGTPFRPGVQQNPRTPIRLTIGTNFEIYLSVIRPNKQPVDLTGASLGFTIKKSPTDSTPVIHKLAVVSPNTQRSGLAIFAGIPTDFRSVLPGVYVYDITLLQGSGQRDVVMPLSPCFIEATAATSLTAL
jgi:hypothetical protein